MSTGFETRELLNSDRNEWIKLSTIKNHRIIKNNFKKLIETKISLYHSK